MTQEMVMKDSKPLSFAAAARRVTFVIYVGLALTADLAANANGYETAAALQASKILPADLRSGSNYRVEERVTNDGYLNTYRIGSKFGTFTAVSTAMLRKRIGEVKALVVMEKIKGTTEFTNSLKQARGKYIGKRKKSVHKSVRHPKRCGRRSRRRVSQSE